MPTEIRKASFGLSYLWAIMLALLVVAAAVGWFRLGTPKVETYEQKRGEERLAKRQQMNVEDQQKLRHFAVLDKAKGTVQLPIDEAVKLVASELQAKQVVASNVKVENPYPYGLAQPAATPAATGTTEAKK
jgi:hypothetical protein